MYIYFGTEERTRRRGGEWGMGAKWVVGSYQVLYCINRFEPNLQDGDLLDAGFYQVVDGTCFSGSKNTRLGCVYSGSPVCWSWCR